jgi:hypothetical protein
MSAISRPRRGAVRHGRRRIEAEGIASLMRRTLMRTMAPIFNSLRRIVAHDAAANWVRARPMRLNAQTST